MEWVGRADFAITLLASGCIWGVNPEFRPGDDFHADTTDSGDGDSGDSDGDTGDGDGDGDPGPGPCENFQPTVELHRLLASASGFPDPLTSSNASNIELSVSENSMVDDEDRIYLYFDHDMAGQSLTTQFSYFVLELNDAGCALNAAVDIASLDLVDAPIVDFSDATAEPVEQGELGGGPEGEGVNVWDITEIGLQDPDCDQSVRDSVAFSINGGPYDLLWDYPGVAAVIRETRIYAGRELDVCL
ncbi:hypothetical protein ENSA5_47990 [Enhygromyxa salina]|uniref:Uncharacterized protein n=1 Tax=Enhygromyxa salina TaxID=215803 RepID=A0A2S9XIA6_9BACT|nr:hypothetical protein [Enhygromyxa salina]PRP92618.1 hypothetical protein ENSA5_47990 [Enhygromyxa salina]